MSTYLLDAGRAAWVDESRQQDSFFNTPTLALDGTGGDERRAFIWFPNPVSRRSDVILRATLTLHLSNTWAGTTTLTVKRVTETWKQREVKWGASGSNPNVSGTNAGTQSIVSGAAGDLVEVDVTAMMQDVGAGGDWYGFRLEVDANGPLRVHSPDSTTPLYRPTLSVDVTTKPDAPDALRPDGTAFAISDTYPVFRWEYSSSDVNAYQAQSQVQVTTTEGDYSTTVYDSDWVDNDITDWDSELDVVPPTFAYNTQYYWQVRVKDQNGQESPWSDEATFIRQAPGDVQITSPEYDNADTSDNSPTITWYTDDLVQTQTRIRVYDGTGNTLGDLLYERPWAADAQAFLDDGVTPVDYDSYTIPAAVPKRSGKGATIISVPNNTYAVEVAIRDEYARRDDDFITDVRYFEYVPDLTITAPTGAAVTTDVGIARLTWQRASAPDQWCVYRNGSLIETIDGAEAFVAGTTYEYYDYTAKPGVSYTYAVRAKTLSTGAQSAESTASAVTLTVVGVWLYDPDNDVRIPILGDESVAQQLTETAASFMPLNRQDAVRVVARIGGYAGSVGGTIAPYGAFTVDGILADLEGVFGTRSTASLRLVFGSRNIAVNVGNLNVSQHPTLAGDKAQYAVSFEWWQVGSFSVEVN